MLQLKFTRLARSGGRKSRREGFVRAKKDGLLVVCLAAHHQLERPSQDGTDIGYAVITSKKSVSKQAVVRNKARRRTRAALFHLRHDEQLTRLANEFSHLELLIVHQRNLNDLPFETFVHMLREALLCLAENIQKKLRGLND